MTKTIQVLLACNPRPHCWRVDQKFKVILGHLRGGEGRERGGGGGGKDRREAQRREKEVRRLLKITFGRHGLNAHLICFLVNEGENGDFEEMVHSRTAIMKPHRRQYQHSCYSWKSNPKIIKDVLI